MFSQRTSSARYCYFDNYFWLLYLRQFFLCTLIIIIGLSLGACTRYVEVNEPYELLIAGPNLEIYGQLKAEHFEGTMARSVMVGVGEISLSSLENAYTCSGTLESPPSSKRRVYNILDCSHNELLFLIINPTGPDQGFAVGSFFKVNNEELEREELERAEPLISELKTETLADLFNSGLLKSGDHEALVLFFHPSRAEAERRLVDVKLVMDELIANNSIAFQKKLFRAAISAAESSQKRVQTQE